MSSLPTAVILDRSGVAPTPPKAWPPLLVTKETIEAEIERLARAPAPPNGVRSATIVHPSADGAFPGFSPGTDVTINVLGPGEATRPRRTSANQIEICIRGSGVVEASETLNPVLHDVWTIPPMETHRHRNDGEDLWVRLTYSNAPLLDKLGTLFGEEGDLPIAPKRTSAAPTSVAEELYKRETAPDIEMSQAGARLRGYEFLTDIEAVESKPLLWKWEDIAPYMPLREGDNKRNIWLLYNPATEKRQGTSASFFATYGGCAPGAPPIAATRGHKHMSASINYHTRGFGKSVVDGVTVEWKAGDLLFSAPSWSEHCHYHGEEGWTVLTIQDHPMHIALGSLLWQEDMDGPILSLGAEQGQRGYVAPREKGA